MNGTTTAQAASNSQPAVGQLFGLPGMTQPFEQFDTNVGNVTNLSLSAQVSYSPPSPFQKTDISRWYEVQFSVDFTTAVTGSTLSPYAPYNFLQNPTLSMQGQYRPLECQSGIDMFLFQNYRPMRGRGQKTVQNNLGANVAATYANNAVAQANQITTGITANPAANALWNFDLEIPVSIFIDQYWNLAIDGGIVPGANGLAAPVAATVSPQYMAGGERNVQLKTKFAPINADNIADGPLVGSTAGAGTVTTNTRRVGYYGSLSPATQPNVYQWQYRRTSKNIPCGGQQKIDLPIDEYGQLLSCWAYIVDPTAGTVYNIANVSKTQLLYGSGLTRFDDNPESMQRRFTDQHGFLPPVGVVGIWDMLANTSGGGLSNDSRVLNTLTNANTHVHVELTVAPSATAYAVLGMELLVPTITQ